uniref:Uncharacterized protein n=1 Tax=Ceratitis capitata TaxID=7213 RepID=W8B161_CERCA
MEITMGRMCRRTCLLFLILFTFEFLDLTKADESQPIRDLSETLKSVIYSLNLIENKLMRHEWRERALGELLKKGQRNIVASLHDIDLRLRQNELLLKKPEVHFDAPYYDHYKRLVSPSSYPMDAANRKMLLPQQMPASGGLIKETEENKPEISEQLTQISANIEILLDTSRQLIAQKVACKQQSEPKEQLPPSIVVEKAADNSTNISEQIMKISTNVENLLDTSNYLMQQASLRRSPIPTINNEFENKLLMKFDELAAGVQELRVQDKSKKEYALANVDRELIYGLTNDTLSAIENTKTILKSNADRVYSDITTIIKLTAETNRRDADRILKDTDRLTYWLGNIYEIISANSPENSNKSDEVLCKSKTELQNNTGNGYSTQFNDLLDKQREEIVNKLVIFLKELENSFYRTQTEAMDNLNSTIKSEISYIWRQISITNGDITNTAELLRQIRSRSEVFVNSVLQSIVSTGDKVEDIKGRMSDIHTNQDYLLENLFLLSQNIDVIKEKVSNTQE